MAKADKQKKKDKKKKGKKKTGSDKREDNFPHFPTEVDIMIEVVGRNVDLILKTCDKGNGYTLFRLLHLRLHS